MIGREVGGVIGEAMGARAMTGNTFTLSQAGKTLPRLVLATALPGFVSAAWLSQPVLGVKPVEPGSARVVVSPEFGQFRWAEGSCPTPLGPIHFRHERQADGSIRSDIRAPDGVTVDLQDL